MPLFSIPKSELPEIITIDSSELDNWYTIKFNCHGNSYFAHSKSSGSIYFDRPSIVWYPSWMSLITSDWRGVLLFYKDDAQKIINEMCEKRSFNTPTTPDDFEIICARDLPTASVIVKEKWIKVPCYTFKFTDTYPGWEPFKSFKHNNPNWRNYNIPNFFKPQELDESLKLNESPLFSVSKPELPETATLTKDYYVIADDDYSYVGFSIEYLIDSLKDDTSDSDWSWMYLDPADIDDDVKNIIYFKSKEDAQKFEYKCLIRTPAILTLGELQNSSSSYYDEINDANYFYEDYNDFIQVEGTELVRFPYVFTDSTIVETWMSKECYDKICNSFSEAEYVLGNLYPDYFPKVNISENLTINESPLFHIPHPELPVIENSSEFDDWWFVRFRKSTYPYYAYDHERVDNKSPNTSWTSNKSYNSIYFKKDEANIFIQKALEIWTSYTDNDWSIEKAELIPSKLIRVPINIMNEQRIRSCAGWVDYEKFDKYHSDWKTYNIKDFFEPWPEGLDEDLKLQNRNRIENLNESPLFTPSYPEDRTIFSINEAKNLYLVVSKFDDPHSNTQYLGFHRPGFIDILKITSKNNLDSINQVQNLNTPLTWMGASTDSNITVFDDIEAANIALQEALKYDDSSQVINVSDLPEGDITNVLDGEFVKIPLITEPFNAGEYVVVAAWIKTRAWGTFDNIFRNQLNNLFPVYFSYNLDEALNKKYLTESPLFTPPVNPEFEGIWCVAGKEFGDIWYYAFSTRQNELQTSISKNCLGNCTSQSRIANGELENLYVDDQFWKYAVFFKTEKEAQDYIKTVEEYDLKPCFIPREYMNISSELIKVKIAKYSWLKPCIGYINKELVDSCSKNSDIVNKCRVTESLDLRESPLFTVSSYNIMDYNFDKPLYTIFWYNFSNPGDIKDGQILVSDKCKYGRIWLDTRRLTSDTPVLLFETKEEAQDIIKFRGYINCTVIDIRELYEALGIKLVNICLRRVPLRFIELIQKDVIFPCWIRNDFFEKTWLPQLKLREDPESLILVSWWPEEYIDDLNLDESLNKLNESPLFSNTKGIENYLEQVNEAWYIYDENDGGRVWGIDAYDYRRFNSVSWDFKNHYIGLYRPEVRDIEKYSAFFLTQADAEYVKEYLFNHMYSRYQWRTDGVEVRKIKFDSPITLVELPTTNNSCQQKFTAYFNFDVIKNSDEWQPKSNAERIDPRYGYYIKYYLENIEELNESLILKESPLFTNSDNLETKIVRSDEPLYCVEFNGYRDWKPNSARAFKNYQFKCISVEDWYKLMTDQPLDFGWGTSLYGDYINILPNCCIFFSTPEEAENWIRTMEQGHPNDYHVADLRVIFKDEIELVKLPIIPKKLLGGTEVYDIWVSKKAFDQKIDEFKLSNLQDIYPEYF